MEDRKSYRKLYIQANKGDVYPFIPGQILQVSVKVGDTVKKGDKLMVLEAMKMHNDILSPISGVVKKLNVSAHDRVSKNDVLVTIE